jgi:flagellar biosynthesis chaperone FliJ
MRRYRFALAPVLRVRRIEQDAAQAAVTGARSALDEAEVELQRSMARYHGRPLPAGPEAAATWLTHRSRADLVAASVVAAGTRHGLAGLRMEEQREALRRARMRVTALERLDERRREDHAVESRRTEDAEADELVTSRHGRTS